MYFLQNSLKVKQLYHFDIVLYLNKIIWSRVVHIADSPKNSSKVKKLESQFFYENVLHSWNKAIGRVLIHIPDLRLVWRRNNVKFYIVYNPSKAIGSVLIHVADFVQLRRHL